MTKVSTGNHILGIHDEHILDEEYSAIRSDGTLIAGVSSLGRDDLKPY